jgi:hypothetical protein
MWKKEDRDSKIKLDNTLDYLCLKDCIVITLSRKDQEILQYSARFNQILPAEASRVQFAWVEA